MATDTEKKTTTQPKRLARAKVRRPETPEEIAKTKADRKKAIRNVASSAFAVLLVLSMMTALCFTASAAAVPHAWPITPIVPITRAEAKAMCEAEMLRPANMRFATFFE